MLLTSVDPAKAKLAQRDQLGAIHMPRLVPFSGVRTQLTHGEILRHVENHRLFFSQKHPSILV